ncbi:serine hydrolase domain-containing protein [Sphingomonas sp. UYP23]
MKEDGSNRYGAGRLFITAITVALGAIPATAQQTDEAKTFVSKDAERLGFKPEALAAIGQAYEAGVMSHEIPGAVVMIARDNKLVYSMTAGYRNASAKKRMAADTRFYLASMTKPITSVAAMILVERCKLQLDDPVSKYIPEFANLRVGREITDSHSKLSLALDPADHPATVRDLFRHTAGFTYGPFGSSLVQQAYMHANLADFGQTNAELMTKLAALPLAYQPGEVFEYSMATDVLGRVIEIVSKQSLADFVQKEITGPLGMKDTSFGVPDAERVAVPLSMPVSYPAGVPRWFSGGGGLISTAADYLKFAQMLLNGGEYNGVKILSPQTIMKMTRNELPVNITYSPLDLGILEPSPANGQGFGYGFAVRVSDKGNKAPGTIGDYHWAGISGTYFWIDPKKKMVVVAMIAAPEARDGYRIKARNLVYSAISK